MAITDLELRITIKTLAAKGQSNRAIARKLDLCEGKVRYHLRQIGAGAVDGRGRQRRRASTPVGASVASERPNVQNWPNCAGRAAGAVAP